MIKKTTMEMAMIIVKIADDGNDNDDGNDDYDGNGDDDGNDDEDGNDDDLKVTASHLSPGWH